MNRSVVFIALASVSIGYGANQETPPVKSSMDLMGHYQVQDAYDFTITASALYWQPQEEGLDYVIKNIGSTQVNDEGSVERVSFDWNWGARVDLGYQVPNQKMVLDLCWTFYETEGHSNKSAVYPETLFSVWSVPNSSNHLANEKQAKAHSSLHLNTIDFGMKATFSPLRFLEITPCIDLSTVWIFQKFQFDLSGGSGLNLGVVLDDQIRMKNNYWGIGPKFGLDTLWDLGCGFGICGNFNMSLLYGFFHVTQDETVTWSLFNTPSTYLDIDHNRFYVSRLNFDLFLGVRWDKMLSNDRYHLLLEAGWENLIFLGQNQLMRFPTVSYYGINIPSQGDLSVQGLSMRAGLTF